MATKVRIKETGVAYPFVRLENPFGGLNTCYVYLEEGEEKKVKSINATIVDD